MKIVIDATVWVARKKVPVNFPVSLFVCKQLSPTALTRTASLPHSSPWRSQESTQEQNREGLYCEWPKLKI